MPERKKIMRTPEIGEWVYLGDGVSVSYDGYHLVLVATTGERPEDAALRIALDPVAWSWLKKFAEAVNP